MPGFCVWMDHMYFQKEFRDELEGFADLLQYVAVIDRQRGIVIDVYKRQVPICCSERAIALSAFCTIIVPSKRSGGFLHTSQFPQSQVVFSPK